MRELKDGKSDLIILVLRESTYIIPKVIDPGGEQC